MGPRILLLVTEEAVGIFILDLGGIIDLSMGEVDNVPLLKY